LKEEKYCQINGEGEKYGQTIGPGKVKMKRTWNILIENGKNGNEAKTLGMRILNSEY